MNRSNSKNIAFYLSTFASLGSIIVHSILAKKHYQLRYGESEGGGICNMNDLFSCDAASNSNFSEVLGVPVAVFGILLNALLFGAILYNYFKSEDDQSFGVSLAKSLSVVILLASLVMGTLSFLVVKSLCPYCLMAYGLSIVTFFGVKTLWPTSSLVSIFTKHLKSAAILGVGVSFAAIAINSQIKSQFVSDVELELQDLAVKEWKNKSEARIDLVSPTELNSTDATMHIVEFADFLCGHCKEAYPKLHSFAQSRGVRLSFQSFPLDGECNKAVDHVVGSRCLLAKMAYCSESVSQKGWKAQEWIFEQQTKLVSKESIEALMPEFAANTGVDLNKVNECIKKEETLDIIKQQAALGQNLGVEGTPAIFVNGKKLGGRLTIPLLESIHQELKKKN